MRSILCVHSDVPLLLVASTSSCSLHQLFHGHAATRPTFCSNSVQFCRFFGHSTQQYGPCLVVSVLLGKRRNELPDRKRKWSIHFLSPSTLLKSHHHCFSTKEAIPRWSVF